MSNYTPLDLSLLLREGGGGALYQPRKKDGFDKLFFPFALLVLIMSLSFYVVKQVWSTFVSTPNQSVEQTQSPQAVVTEFAAKQSPTPVPAPKVYQDLNGVLVDSDRILSTAEAQYPNLSSPELVELVNKSLVEWAALRRYYEDQPEVVGKLSLKTDTPIATFGAVLRDVGEMVRLYDKAASSSAKPSIATLVEAYTSNSKIR